MPASRQAIPYVPENIGFAQNVFPVIRLIVNELKIPDIGISDVYRDLKVSREITEGNVDFVSSKRR